MALRAAKCDDDARRIEKSFCFRELPSRDRKEADVDGRGVYSGGDVDLRSGLN